MPQSMGVQSVSDYRNPMARLALPSVPGSTYSTPSSAVPRQDGTAGPQTKKRPAGPDCQHISERLVEEVVQEKCRQIRL